MDKDFGIFEGVENVSKKTLLTAVHGLLLLLVAVEGDGQGVERELAQAVVAQVDQAEVGEARERVGRQLLDRVVVGVDLGRTERRLQ